MYKTIISLATLLIFVGTFAYAGPGHNHSHDHATPITDVQAIEKATSIVKKIVDSGKLDVSWTQTKEPVAEKKKGHHGPEWVVTFKNPKAKDKAKQTLNVFLSLSGQYIAANFLGTK